MSKSKLDLWISIAKERYPNLNEDQLMVLSMTAANAWYLDDGSGTDPLVELYDQYVMMKTLSSAT